MKDETKELLAWGNAQKRRAVEGPIDDFLGVVNDAAHAIGTAPTTIVDAVHAAPSPVTAPIAMPAIPVATSPVAPAAAPSPAPAASSSSSPATPAASSGPFAFLSHLPWYAKIAVGGFFLAGVAFAVDATRAHSGPT